MKRPEFRHVMAVAAAASALLVAAAPAQASRSGGDPSTEPEVEVPGGGPLAPIGLLYPGSTGLSTFSVTNPSGDDAALHFRIVGLTEDDNGCVRPETDYGDVTCGDGGGELGRDLRMTMVPIDGGGNPTGPAVVDSPLRGLQDWTVIAASLAGGAQQHFRLDWALPPGSPNDTQTDTVTFDAEFAFEQDFGGGDDLTGGSDDSTGGTAGGGDGTAVPQAGSPLPDSSVLGVQLEPAPAEPTGPPVRIPGTELPRTGTESFEAAEIGAAAVVAGGFLLTVARRRRHRTAS